MSGLVAVAADRKPQPEARGPGGQGAKREGSEGQRPGLPGSCCWEVRGEKNNDSGLQEEGGPAATFSLLLCRLPVARACPLEKILKAALVSMMLCFFFKNEGSRLSLLSSAFHVIYSLRSFPSSIFLGDGKCVLGQSSPPNGVPPKNHRRSMRFL